jgi:protein tyrosine phosphatase (PTP) superfamily phosphohydrolase (DUF442 family)
MFGYRTLMAKMRLGFKTLTDAVRDRYLEAKKKVLDAVSAIKAKLMDTKNPTAIKMQAKIEQQKAKAMQKQVEFMRKLDGKIAERQLAKAKKRIEELENIILSAERVGTNSISAYAVRDAQSALGLEREFYNKIAIKCGEKTKIEIELEKASDELDNFYNGCHNTSINLGADKHIRGEC